MNNHSFSRRKFVATTLLGVSGVALWKARAISKITGGLGLKDYFKDDFLIGAAVGSRTIMGNNTDLLELVAREFNAVTSENSMKWGVVQPNSDVWKFDEPDKLVQFGINNQIHVHGHVLVWHSQAPRDLFTDQQGGQISREDLVKRLENHIQTLVDRYRGKIKSWDVVNEAFVAEGYRNSKWYSIIGPDYIGQAFHLAHEADPQCQLLYNDYNEEEPSRRAKIVDMVNDFNKRGIPIHGIGMQGHLDLGKTDLKEWEKSIEAFAMTGMRVHISELDVDVLPYDWGKTSDVSFGRGYSDELNPYAEGLPAEMEDKLASRYEQIFKILLRHRDKIDRVTFWGISDETSWKNNFPVRGRTNYPLLFDRAHNPKKAYYKVTDLKRNI